MDDACREALKLWLEYDRNRRNLLARLYAHRDQAAEVQELLDQNDRLRDRAVDLTTKLLAEDCPSA